MLKIYNSLSNQIETFIPLNKNKVNMYVCGPTVYDDIHIGNGRPVVFFDVLKRYLLFLGYEVTYASNITDVDDKIIEKANQLQMTEKALSTKYADAFFNVVKAVNSLDFDMTPYATNYIDQMIEFIDALIKDGYAYVTDNGVYFRVSKINDYGILSNQKLDQLKTGVRIDLETNKESDADFVLWKTTSEGISFKSPWGNGRPGWHTECVVMNNAIFNTELDIHGGGFDLKFPHHENEIAQSMAHNHHHLSKYWMHVGRLDLDKEKMSKSLGNDIKLVNLLKNYNANSYRLMLLAHHYRQPIGFNNDLIEQYQKAYDKISYTLNKWHFNFVLNQNDELLSDEASIESFKQFMDDDFNTPNVVTLIDGLLKTLNKESNKKIYNAIMVILDCLGIKPNILEVTKEDINNYRMWETARVQKDFKKADELRNLLSTKGWI